VQNASINTVANVINITERLTLKWLCLLSAAYV